MSRETGSNTDGISSDVTRPFVSIDPAMLSGMPCLSGKRIPVIAVAEVSWSEGVAAAQEVWSLTRPEVLVACWFAGAYGTLLLWQEGEEVVDRHYREDPVSGEWIVRWRGWAQEAGPALWRGSFNQVGDPPRQPAH